MLPHSAAFDLLPLTCCLTLLPLTIQDDATKRHKMEAQAAQRQVAHHSGAPLAMLRQPDETLSRTMTLTSKPSYVESYTAPY